MKRHAKPVLILALLGALIALAKEVVVDYDHSVDFANYKTYSWISVKVGDPLWVERVTRTIDAELVAKGWTRVDATTVQETPVGTLVVDIFDEPKMRLIRRGLAEDALSGKPGKDEKKLKREIVADMFKKFPPPPRA